MFDEAAAHILFGVDVAEEGGKMTPGARCAAAVQQPAINLTFVPRVACAVWRHQNVANMAGPRRRDRRAGRQPPMRDPGLDRR